MLTAQVEDLAGHLEELKPFFPAHWEELGIFKDRMPLAPSYARYLRATAGGEVTLVTVRRDGRLCGYAVFFLDFMPLHYGQTPTARADIFYLPPEERRTGAGKAMFTQAEAELRRRGIKCWWVGFKIDHDLEQFFRSMGFEPYETHCAKWLGGEDA